MVKKVEIINLIIVFINIKFIIENLMEFTLIIKLFFKYYIIIIELHRKGSFQKVNEEKVKIMVKEEDLKGYLRNSCKGHIDNLW
jgi:predicted membrane protein